MTEQIQSDSFGRRRFLAGGLGLTTLAVAAPSVLAACGSSKKASTATTTAAPAAAAASGASSVEALVAAAKKEGKINLIALPNTWANYEGILAGFKAKYGLDFNVANPDGSSADEITAVQTLKGQKTQPDAIDVGPGFARDNIALFAPYKVSVFDEVPTELKDPNGAWTGGYYGVMSLGSDTKAAGGAPTSFKELADPKYKGKFGLNGDPRKSSSGLNGVWAAALANGGSFDDIGPGIEYFAKLKKDGILLPIDVTPAVIASGQVSIALDWSYNFPGLVPELKKSNIELAVNVPTDGVMGNFYAQGAVASSPNPNAAKLWMEWLIGDEGALLYLAGGAFPARFAKMLAAGKVPADLKAKLPTEEIMKKVSFPTAAQATKAKEAIAKDWGPKVAGN